MKIIYDFGSNNGDDINYYLKKGDLVVAVEANPILVEKLESRFSKEIAEGKVVVIGCVLTNEETTESVPFYIHKTFHPGSQFPRPAEPELHKYDLAHLPAMRASEIIKKHGEPYYVKIDIEHFDQAILEELFQAGIRPAFISAESHDISVFSTLVALGKYNAFKIVDGKTVADRYKNHPISTNNGAETYSFPIHSAGPFGEDIAGQWLSANQMFHLLAYLKLGWKDIHATNTQLPDLEYKVPQEIPLRILLKSLPGSVIQQIRRKLGRIIH